MMRKTTYLAAGVLALSLAACQKTQMTAIKAPDAVAAYDAIPPQLKTDAISVAYTDESAFVSSLSSYGFKNPSQITLNRIATTSGYNTVHGFNIPAANQVKGFKWNTGDQDTEDWRPQGICGFAWGSKTYILTTWYGVGPDDIDGEHNHYKGSRLALVDITNMSNITYRLILLVQNKANAGSGILYDQPDTQYENPVIYDSFIPVTMHAGGVAYMDQKIYVADTSLGFRVFDLNKLIDNVISDPTKNSIGKKTNGDLIAFDYTCILPQTGYYRVTGGGTPFSSVSLGSGATASDKRLWTTQFKTDTVTAKMYGFPISSTGVVTGPPSVITPRDNTAAPSKLMHAQGAYKAGTTSFNTITGQDPYEGSTARLVKYIDGQAQGTRYRWPAGAEALYVDAGGLIWCLTEYETSHYGEQNRTVFAVRLSDYQ